MIEAFSDVIERIFKEVNEIILNSTISENFFKEILEITMDELKEKQNSLPYMKGFFYFNKIIEKNSTHYRQNLQVKYEIYEEYKINKF